MNDEPRELSNTKMADIIFDDTSGSLICNLLASYGKIKPRQDDEIIIPEISLNKVVTRQKEINGYRVNLEWQMSKQIQQTDITNLSCSYRNRDDDDEKKQDSEWNIANHEKADHHDNNSNSIAITNLFHYDRKYEYQISMTITNPITMTIKSNIIASSLNKPKIQQIPLTVHSYRGYASPFQPKCE